MHHICRYKAHRKIHETLFLKAKFPTEGRSYPTQILLEHLICIQPTVRSILTLGKLSIFIQ